MSEAENFYNELAGVEDEDSLIAVMDRAYEECESYEIKGDETYFLFTDGSFLRTLIQGNDLNTWHGFIKTSNTIH